MDKVAFVAGFLLKLAESGVPYEIGGQLLKSADGRFTGHWETDPKTGRSVYVKNPNPEVARGSFVEVGVTPTATPVKPTATTPPPTATSSAPPALGAGPAPNLYPPVVSSDPYWSSDAYRKLIERYYDPRRAVVVQDDGTFIPLTPAENVKKKRAARAAAAASAGATGSESSFAATGH